MRRRRIRIDVAWLLALAAFLAVPAACGRSEKPAPAKAPTPAPASAPGTAPAPQGSLGRQVKEGEAKVGDVVRESAGSGAPAVERGSRLPGPTPTIPAGSQRLRY